MLTKREFCEAIVRDKIKSLNIPNRKDAHSFIYQSSKLAVALEYLGELSPEEVEYSSCRAGILARYIDFGSDNSFMDVYFLTLREMIQLLPETVPDRENKNN